MKRIAGLGVLSLVTLSCATAHYYARRPEPERSSHVFATAIRVGMTLPDVVRSLAEARLPNQYASLSSEGPSGDVVTIILHAGEPLFTVGHTQVFAGGYASIQVYHRAETRLESHVLSLT